MPLITRCNSADHTTTRPQLVLIGPFPSGSRLLRLDITIICNLDTNHPIGAVLHASSTVTTATIAAGHSIFDRTGFNFANTKVMYLPKPSLNPGTWTYRPNITILSGPMYLHIYHRPAGMQAPTNDSTYIVTASVPPGQRDNHA